MRDTPLPDKPQRRRPIRVWVRSGYALLVFGGFMSASTTDRSSDPHWRRRTVIGVLPPRADTGLF